jgi:carbonic anhydrase
MRSKKLATIALLGLWLGAAARAESAEATPSLTPDQALDKLMQGNRRYLFARMSHPVSNEERRREVAKAQHPFAVILGCADSRVSPEIVFDEGLGDLFVVRVAGNIVDDAILGSIEYAVEHLGTSVVLVLGHERCGAVQAAVAGGEAPGHVGVLVQCIRPAVDSTRGLPGDPVDNAVRANVTIMVQQLRRSTPILSAAVAAGKLRIVGGRYDLDTGVVEILPDPSAAGGGL